MRDIMDKGVEYPLDEIKKEELQKDLHEMIDRGNHKSATLKENEKSLLKNYEVEVKHGWMLPMTVNSIRKLVGAAVIPIGVATQTTVDENGDRYTKRRTTHDASFAPPSGKSINNRMDREALEPCFYGHCLLRFLHSIHRMRIEHPTLLILLIKYDLDAAYRRLHVLAKMAALAITILNDMAYILLRLPFGVANGPSDYCLVSEPVVDLANDLLRDNSWNPGTTYSPLQNKMDEPKTKYDNNTPFEKARPLFVPVPFSPAVVDGYIDDLITAVVVKEDWLRMIIVFKCGRSKGCH